MIGSCSIGQSLAWPAPANETCHFLSWPKPDWCSTSDTNFIKLFWAEIVIS